PETNDALRDILVPKAVVVTPNLFEASQLAGTAPIRTLEDMKEAAARIQEQGAKYVLVKGGSKIGLPTSVDVLYDGKSFEILDADLIDTTYTHGAGCTYSAAVAAELAKGNDVRESVH
ncbi:bifunctional hydroxymethylpyrimidine kinase/phosphomethylpyrimidine kinase, partial [Enterobacter quasiroggenkampii]|nr:bifunctional hydroxymethylpyrimidine kinase/phosphomethylpyrimidine kinase [Enterobacter quasiroggenkampii]